jgi:tetratricopeptide (TPR) repeat protein
LARFRTEAEAIARLQHPNVVQIFGVGLAAEGPYFTMELLEGGTLGARISGTPWPPRAAAEMAQTLARATHYAHGRGIIHRDLKPGNVLLTADGTPKVTDFGLAKLFADPGAGHTRSESLLGTPSYMAPEQAEARREVGPATDVYALGAILYELLTGRPPFQGESPLATLLQVTQTERVPVRRLQPKVPLDLETICLKCLQKTPGKRYASAEALADDLGRFLAGQPVRARPVGTGERVVRWCRRKPGVAGLLAALALVFLAGSSGVVWQWQRASRNAAAFRRQRDTAQQEKARAEHHLQMVRDRVDRLNRLGSDLLLRPGQYRTGQTVLEEALAFYKEMLPEDLNDPRVRREAAQLFRQVAAIYLTLGQMGKAAEAYGHQASLLTSLLKGEPASKALRIELADAYRWHGNALRDLGKAREAREAYDQAAGLHEGLVCEYPDEALYKVALANTLLNITRLLSHRDQAEEVERLYRGIVKLYRAAVRSAPDNLQFNTELALGLEYQGLFFMDMGRAAQAEAGVREALKIHQRLLAGGHLKGSIERYLARKLVSLGRVLAAAGRARKAEQSYRQAVNLLDRFVEVFPESALRRADLAQTLAGLADLLKDAGRRQEAEEIRRGVVRQYETLKAEFPENLRYRRHLVKSYLELVSLLWELGRQAKAAEPYRKALALESQDPALNNDLAWFLATSPEPRLRDAALAVRLAKKAVAAQRQSGEHRNTLGVAHYRNGDYKAAVAELETAMSLRKGGDGFDWFFLAMAHWRLGDRDQARKWCDQAVRWMQRHQPRDKELRRFRAEAADLLGVQSEPE